MKGKVRFLGMIIVVLTIFLQLQPAHAESTTPTNDRLVLTLLRPKIQEQVNHYYQEKLKVPPTFAPFLGPVDLKVQYFASHIVVNVTITPYVGPHLSVGLDAITLRIDNLGTVQTLHFTHLKDYALPPNWESIIKKNRS